VNSQLTADFLACFVKLPDSVNEQARRCYRLWRDNPAHPSLHFKRIHGQENLYSVRVGLGWRALGLLEGNTITWFWIGSHAEYDRLIS
jgi:hypothetical protein